MASGRRIPPTRAPAAYDGPFVDWPADLACLGAPARLDAGESLFLRGRAPTYMFWVECGEVQLQRASPDGRQVILQRVRQGFVAEASLQAARYHCDAVATKSSAIWRFPRECMLQALRATPELALWWAARLAEQLRGARLSLERLNLKGARDRIQHAIDTDGTCGRLTLACTRRDWAAELGLTPEALYRSLARLQRDGLLQIHGRELQRLTEPAAPCRRLPTRGPSRPLRCSRGTRT